MENPQKEKLIQSLEKFINQESSKEEILNNLNEIKINQELMNEELIKQIVLELLNSFDELSRKEIKQRILMLKTYDK